jgi:hypothetical protein
MSCSCILLFFPLFSVFEAVCSLLFQSFVSSSPFAVHNCGPGVSSFCPSRMDISIGLKFISAFILDVIRCNLSNYCVLAKFLFSIFRVVKLLHRITVMLSQNFVLLLMFHVPRPAVNHVFYSSLLSESLPSLLLSLPFRFLFLGVTDFARVAIDCNFFAPAGFSNGTFSFQMDLQ